MQEVGHGDDGEVDRPGGERVHRRVDGKARHHAERLARRGFGVGDGHDFEVLVLAQQGEPQLTARPAEPDDGHPDAHTALTASAMIAAVRCMSSSEASSVRWCSQMQSWLMASELGQRSASSSGVASGAPISQKASVR